MTKLERVEKLEKQLSELKEEIKKDSTPKYPYLGVHKDGALVFFDKPDRGILVYGTGCWSKVGETSSAWRESVFLPYEVKNGNR